MYKILKWNGEYGEECKFVVQDMDTGKQTLFTPGRTQDIVWTTTKLDESPEMQDWSDFGDETVDNLEDVAM